jgi:hypothetical protein
MRSPRQSSLHESNRTGGIVSTGKLPFFPHKILLALNLCVNTSYNISTKYMMTGLHPNEIVYLLALRVFSLVCACYTMQGEWKELWLIVTSTSFLNCLVSFVIFTCRLLVHFVFVWSFRYIGIAAVFIIVNCGVIFQCAADTLLVRGHMTCSVCYTFAVILMSALTFQLNAFNLTPASVDERVSYVIACAMCMGGQILLVLLNTFSNYARDSNPFLSHRFPAVLWDTILLAGAVFIHWDAFIIKSVSSVYFIVSVISSIVQTGVKLRLCMSVSTYITDTIEMAGYIVLYPTLVFIRIETLSGVSVCCFFVMLLSMYHYGLLCSKYIVTIIPTPRAPVSTTSHNPIAIDPVDV